MTDRSDLLASSLRRGLALYDLEEYVFETVGPSFRRDGEVPAFDFFCIISWKANRATSYVARRLMRKADSLDGAVHNLTAGLASAATAKARFELLRKFWGFALPMASAILTVFYPDEFTVYDVRVCAALAAQGVRGMERVRTITDVDRQWAEYQRFVEAVRAATPGVAMLRDKDRALWGLSFGEDLDAKILNRFGLA
jgi:hypothetical protein